MKKLLTLLLALLLPVACAAAQGSLTAYTTRCGYSITYDTSLYTLAEAGDSVLLNANKLAYNSYISITARREAQKDAEGRIQQEIRDAGLRVDGSTYCTVELPAGGKAYAARYPAMGGVMESVIVQQAGMEFLLSAFYDNDEVEEQYATAFEAVLLSLEADPGGDLSGFDDQTQIWETEEYDGDPFATAIAQYDPVIRPFVYTVQATRRINEDAEGPELSYGISLQDFDGNGIFELVLTVGVEEAEKLCGLYTMDEKGQIISLLPGFGAMYSYELYTTEEGEAVIRRHGQVAGEGAFQSVHYFAIGEKRAEFIEGYIVTEDGAVCSAVDASLAIGKAISEDDASDMDARYGEYQEELAFWASPEDYCFVEGDRDAAEAYAGM